MTDDRRLGNCASSPGVREVRTVAAYESGITLFSVGSMSVVLSARVERLGEGIVVDKVV